MPTSILNTKQFDAHHNILKKRNEHHQSKQIYLSFQFEFYWKLKESLQLFWTMH